MNEIWKYVAISALSLCAGLLTGQYMPNRNLVTKDDLQPLMEHQQQTDTQLLTVQKTLAEIKGKLEAEDSRKGAYEQSN